VANSGSSTVSVYTIDQTTGALTAGTAAETGRGPASVTVDPSGRFAYVANFLSDFVSVYTIDQTTGALAAGTLVAAGLNPWSVTVDPSGRFAYVANTGSGTVSVYTINQATGALTAGTAVAAGIRPVSVTVDSSGRFAYVANYSSNTVSVYTINQTTGALTAGTAVVSGYAPNSVTVDSSGRFAYVANSDSNIVSVFTINQTTGALSFSTSVAAGTQPASVTTTAGYTGAATAPSRTGQTITFGTAPTIIASGTGTVTATASSNLAVTYTSLTMDICSVSGSTVTGVSAGTCAIAAYQAGNTSLSAATQVTQYIIISNPISNARVFAYAEASFPSVFAGTGTAGVYQQYKYRYYPASGNYLAVDTSGVIFILGTYTHGELNTVGPVESFRASISAWEAMGCNSAQVLTNGVCVTLPAGYVSQGGLTWMPVTFSKTWSQANSYCANTTINGQTGWRLPTLAELSGLIIPPPSGQGIATGGVYGSGAMKGPLSTWSSTPYGSGHYVVSSLGNGYSDDGYIRTGDGSSNLSVTCVRYSLGL
jgi:DNA-binding beta-propeller fold protein YncE